jgi:hypothetical protein
MKHNSVDIAALSLEIPLEQIKRPLRIGTRQTKRGHVTRSHGMRHHRRENRHRHPCHHHPPTMGHTPARKTPHCYIPSEQQRETAITKDSRSEAKTFWTDPDLAATPCPRVLAPL